MKFIIQQKRTGKYYAHYGRGLGGTLWTPNVNDAIVYNDESIKEHCLKSLAPNYGKCIAITLN